MNATFTRATILTLTFALCGLPEAIAQTARPLPDAPSARRLMAQNVPAPQNPEVTPAAQQQTSDPAQQTNDQQQQQTPGTDQPRVVPVAPPRAVGTEDQSQQQDTAAQQDQSVEPKTIAPANPAELQRLQSAQQQNEPAEQPPVNNRINPLGTATAEKGQTAGGGASRPAGVAIAPAKQKRSRSLLIKLGAAAAAGAALGTVYGLTRGTKGTPVR